MIIVGVAVANIVVDTGVADIVAVAVDIVDTAVDIVVDTAVALVILTRSQTQSP